MRGELAERNRLLEAAHKKLTFELELARKVQLALMPRPPKPRGVLRLAVRYTPANQLGGDVYDFYRLENNRLGILVADVSGHGVNSAMLSGMVKALARRRCRSPCWSRASSGGAGRGRRAVFSRRLFLHRVLRDRRRGNRAGAVRGSRPPAGDHRRANGPRTLPSNPGMLGIGMVDGTAGAADRIGPGESLVIYTDGLTDAMDPSDALFGEDRLRTLLQSHYGADPAEILNQVDGALDEHTSPGRPADDINIIVLQHLVRVNAPQACRSMLNSKTGSKAALRRRFVRSGLRERRFGTVRSIQLDSMVGLERDRSMAGRTKQISRRFC